MSSARAVTCSIVLMLLLPLLISAQENQKLVILHTNDMHSRLEGYAPSGEYSPLTVNDDNTTGGFSRIAALIEKERSQFPEGTLVVDAGDFLMGTIFHPLEEKTGFQLPLMAEMGYEVMALGNHEFDYGPATLARIIERSAQNGPIPQLLLGNGDFDANDTRDDGLENLFSRGVISRTMVLEKNGLKIGIFSLMGTDADEVAPYAPPVTFSKQTASARMMVRELKSKGCDLIICLSHSGLEKNKKGEWSGEDVKIASKVKGIDIIISGHSHSKLSEPLRINGVTIVQTGSYGSSVGRLDLEVSAGEAVVTEYRLIPVDDSFAGDPEVHRRIEEQKALIDRELLSPLGYEISKPLISTPFELSCDESPDLLEKSNLGPLVADAIYNYVNSSSERGTDIAMVAAGVIRDAIVPGTNSVQDIFRVMSLGSGNDDVPGYPIATVYVTGRELKSVIEILLVAWKSSPSNYCYYSGIEVEYDPDRWLLRKISSVTLSRSDGSMEEVDFSKNNPKLYSISANSYMLEFIGIIKKTTFGLVNVVPKLSDGTPMLSITDAVVDFDPSQERFLEGKEWIALTRLLSEMHDTDGDGVPDMNTFYRNPPLRVIPVERE
ncbi:MAG: bifunctional metallophosphatase/5'-nucleotidase [Bacteroidales bacterium]|nr:bifunctional metallophosphatase/5'-nucleotidase [Bacteroidales bacterium]